MLTYFVTRLQMAVTAEEVADTVGVEVAAGVAEEVVTVAAVEDMMAAVVAEEAVEVAEEGVLIETTDTDRTKRLITIRYRIIKQTVHKPHCKILSLCCKNV